MPIRGWVYVITNKAMPGLVKVGYSTKDPTLRAAELDSTGMPHPYTVVYDVLVQEPRDVEQRVHRILADMSEGKEWFRCTASTAIQKIQDVVGDGILAEAHTPIDVGEGVAITEDVDESSLEEFATAPALPCTVQGCQSPAASAYRGNPYCERHAAFFGGVEPSGSAPPKDRTVSQASLASPCAWRPSKCTELGTTKVGNDWYCPLHAKPVQGIFR